MHPDRGFVRLFAAVLLPLANACATAPSVYGTHARFSPAFQGYVMADEGGSDDPDVGATVLLLRDPLTGDKLRCYEDAVRWRELHEDLAVDAVHDDNVAVAVGVTTGVVFGPLLAIQPTGGLVLAEAMLTADTLVADFSSDDATELLAHGILLYNRKRYGQAVVFIERALAKDAAVGTGDKAYFYLGLAYQAQHKIQRAQLALTMFIERAGVRDVNAYRAAEAALNELGIEREPCVSTEPVELYW